MIKIESLQFSYRSHPLFSGLNLRLKAGTICGLLGKNGVGKTSLLKLITGLLRPEDGKIDVNGQSPFDREATFLQDLFFLPEEFELPRMTSRYFAETYGVFYPNFSMENFERYAHDLEVNLEQNMSKVSFGQKKKAYIAFAMACDTPVLIMDEPTNGLDIPSKASFRRLLASISSEDKLIIVSTHQVRDLNQLIDTVVILENHEILVNASVDTILKKLSFKSLQRGEDALYSEQSVQGYSGVIENTTGEETFFDMELFFNAVVSEKAKIKSIFGDEK